MCEINPADEQKRDSAPLTVKITFPWFMVQSWRFLCSKCFVSRSLDGSPTISQSALAFKRKQVGVALFDSNRPFSAEISPSASKCAGFRRPDEAESRLLPSVELRFRFFLAFRHVLHRLHRHLSEFWVTRHTKRSLFCHWRAEIVVLSFMLRNCRLKLVVPVLLAVIAWNYQAEIMSVYRATVWFVKGMREFTK